MKLSSKVTGGLAWTGLLVVLAVPTADFFTRSNGDRAATLTPQVPASVAAPKADVASSQTKKPVVPKVELVAPVPAVRTVQVVEISRSGTESKTAVKDASVATSKPVTRGTTAGGGEMDVVEEFLASGKKLPSYISDASTAPVATSKAPVAVNKAALPVSVSATPEVKADGTLRPAVDPIEVASVEDANGRRFRADLEAPVPYPASMRPKAPARVAPIVANTEKPLILDEDIVARRDAAVDNVLSSDLDPDGETIIRGDELEEWDSGSLAEYLERRNLLNRRPSSSVSSDDTEGFNIVDRSRAERRVVRRERSDGMLFF